MVKWAQIYIKSVRHISFEKFEDTIGIIISHIFKTDKQYNDQKKKDKYQMIYRILQRK